MNFDPSTLGYIDIALIFAAIFLGALVKGTVGLGLPLIAIPLMSNIVDPRVATAIMTLPIIYSNFSQARAGGNMLVAAVTYRLLLIPVIIGSIIGTTLITSMPLPVAKLILGGFVTIFAIMNLLGWQPKIPKGMDKILQPVLGTISGLIGGMTGIFAPPVVPYIMSLNLEKSKFVQLMGLSFMFGGIPLLIGMIAKGYAPPIVLAFSASAVVAVSIAMSIGKRLREHVPQAIFMKMVAAMLLIIGGKMIWTSTML